LPCPDANGGINLNKLYRVVGGGGGQGQAIWDRKHVVRNIFMPKLAPVLWLEVITFCNCRVVIGHKT
jgi:hypothetical protein